MKRSILYSSDEEMKHTATTISHFVKHDICKEITMDELKRFFMECNSDLEENIVILCLSNSIDNQILRDEIEKFKHKVILITYDLCIDDIDKKNWVSFSFPETTQISIFLSERYRKMSYYRLAKIMMKEIVGSKIHCSLDFRLKRKLFT